MKFFRFASLALPFLFVAVIGLLSAQGSKTLDGKKIFLDQKCNLCHEITSAKIQRTSQSPAMKGPDLTGLIVDKDAKLIAPILRKEAKLPDGKTHAKAFTGSDEELGALIAWLQQQKKNP